eukprot:6457855-Amphidinium_carterae.2
MLEFGVFNIRTTNQASRARIFRELALFGPRRSPWRWIRGAFEVAVVGVVRSHSSCAVMWAPSGEASPVAPEHLVTDCGSGFEFDTTTNLCVPCTPGIGCGFREEDGIVLGVASPLTSLLLRLQLQTSAPPRVLDIRVGNNNPVGKTFSAPAHPVSVWLAGLRVWLHLDLRPFRSTSYLAKERERERERTIV